MADPEASDARIDRTLLDRAEASLPECDPLLGELMHEVGPCQLEPKGDPYRELIRSVVFQQLAGSAARAIHARLRTHFGGRIPRAEVLANTDSEILRELGLSRQKAQTVLEVARAFEQRRLDTRRLRRMSNADVVQSVTQLRGIGEWTAHMLLIFCLGRPDVLPVGDFGVRKGAQLLYRLDDLPKPRELEQIAAPWKPYRSVATWYLWRQSERAAKST